MEKENSQAILVIMSVLAVLSVGAVTIGFFDGKLPTKSAGDKNRSFEISARAMCSVRIKDTLRLPEAVVWKNRAAWPVIEDGANLHTVIAKYRAENGFGGMVNETRQCLVMRRDDRAMVLGIE